MLASLARMIWGATAEKSAETQTTTVKEDQSPSQPVQSSSATSEYKSVAAVVKPAPFIEISELEQYQVKLQTLCRSFEEEASKRREASLTVTSVDELKQTGEEKVDSSDLGKSSVWVTLTRDFNANLEADYHALLDHLLGEYEKLVELKGKFNTDQDYIQLCERSANVCIKLKEFVNKIKTKIENEQNKEEVVHQDLELASFKLLEMIIQASMQPRLAVVARFLFALMPNQVSVAQSTEKNLEIQVEPTLDKINTFMRKMIETLEIFNGLMKSANVVKEASIQSHVSNTAKRVPSLCDLTITVPKVKIQPRRKIKKETKYTRLSQKSLFHPPVHSNPSTPAAAMAVHNTAGDDSPVFPPGMFGPS
ncbi:MAG: hypothetical protein ABI597_09835 [Gammaproteobacteria bacterium]